MAWKDNPMAGIIAVIVVIVAVVGIVIYLNRPAPTREHGGYTFQCSASNETFKITDAEMDKADIYAKYFGKAGEAVDCRLNGQKDAYWVYYCPTDKQYFRYTTRDMGPRDILKCPNGHEIPEENT